MNLIRLLPVFFSFLLIAAHFQRAGLTGVGLTCMVAPGLLFITRPWSVRIVQILLLLSAAEWVLTCIKLVNIRLEHGLDWIRLATILSTVAIFTGCSALVFRTRSLKKKYSL